MPSEWEAVIARLEGFEAETWKQYGRDELGKSIGYAAWRNDATAKLPAGVFVWLDEFEKVFQADVKCTGSYDKPGDDKLTLAPMLDATTRAMVMAGFETLPTTTGESSDAAGKGKAETDTTSGDEGTYRGLDGAPSLKKGRNDREKIGAWVAWQAAYKVKANDTIAELAGRIKLEADRWGYESERKNKDGNYKLTIPNIIKMIPAETTGGRAKNTGKPKKRIGAPIQF